MEFKITHNSKSTALGLAQRADGSKEVGAKEILKNVVLKRTFWLLFRASGKGNSGFGAESPNAPPSREAVLCNSGLGAESPNTTLSSAAALGNSGLGAESPNAPPGSKAEIVVKKEN